jgi:hypothetical protein
VRVRVSQVGGVGEVSQVGGMRGLGIEFVPKPIHSTNSIHSTYFIHSSTHLPIHSLHLQRGGFTLPEAELIAPDFDFDGVAEGGLTSDGEVSAGGETHGE